MTIIFSFLPPTFDQLLIEPSWIAFNWSIVRFLTKTDIPAFFLKASSPFWEINEITM